MHYQFQPPRKISKPDPRLNAPICLFCVCLFFASYLLFLTLAPWYHNVADFPYVYTGPISCDCFLGMNKLETQKNIC